MCQRGLSHIELGFMECVPSGMSSNPETSTAVVEMTYYKQDASRSVTDPAISVGGGGELTPGPPAKKLSVPPNNKT